MPSHFKFKEYCPLVFKNLRERFGIDDVDYRESLTRYQPRKIDSAGRSGAQFYQSYDKLFILKSLTSEEVERMHSFLKESIFKVCPTILYSHRYEWAFIVLFLVNYIEARIKKYHF